MLILMRAQPAVGTVTGSGSTIATCPATRRDEAPNVPPGTLSEASLMALSNVPIRLLLHVVTFVNSPEGAKYSGDPGMTNVVSIVG